MRIIFANKDPLLMYHMLKGGGESISYATAEEFLEMLDVHTAINEQMAKEAEAAHKEKMENQNKRGRG